MRILTMTELMQITRPELTAWEARIVAALADYAEGSPDHVAAITNLRNIRMVLSRSACMRVTCWSPKPGL
ncbi:MAG: hypothetical protein AB7U61_10315 [Methylocystis sp.]